MQRSPEAGSRAVTCDGDPAYTAAACSHAGTTDSTLVNSSTRCNTGIATWHRFGADFTSGELESDGCCCSGACIVPPEQDADPFVFARGGLAAFTGKPLTRSVLPFPPQGPGVGVATRRRIHGVSACGAAAQGSVDTDEGLRNIIAVGQSRFELARKMPPAQPHVERLSEPGT